jgi:hypothetical protein
MHPADEPVLIQPILVSPEGHMVFRSVEDMLAWVREYRSRKATRLIAERRERQGRA